MNFYKTLLIKTTRTWTTITNWGFNWERKEMKRKKKNTDSSLSSVFSKESHLEC